MKRIMQVVKRDKLWVIQSGRKHRKLKKLASDPLTRLNRKNLKEWMKKKITEYTKYAQLQKSQTI